MEILGQIESIPESRTHTEPNAILDLGVSVGGRDMDMTFTFKNTGNVPQTLTMNSVSDFVNCVLTTPGKFIFDGGVESPIVNVAEILPGQLAYYVFAIKLDEFPPGTPLQNYSLHADWSWS